MSNEYDINFDLRHVCERHNTLCFKLTIPTEEEITTHLKDINWDLQETIDFSGVNNCKIADWMREDIEQFIKEMIKVEVK